MNENPRGHGPFPPWGPRRFYRRMPPEHFGRPPWSSTWHDRRRGLILRFISLMGVMGVLVAGGMAILAFMLTHFFGGDGHIVWLVWLGGCLLALALPLMAILLGMRTMRDTAPCNSVVSRLT